VSSVRNRWQRIQKGRARAEEKGNTCHRCGLKRRGHSCTEAEPEVECGLYSVTVKKPRTTYAHSDTTGWTGGLLGGMDIPMTALSVIEPEEPAPHTPLPLDEEADADKLHVLDASAASAPREPRPPVTSDAVTVTSQRAESSLERLEFTFLMAPPEMPSFSAPAEEPPELPPPLVARSYSTASAVLSNLAEPGTTEFQSMRTSASNILVNSRAAVVDSVGTLWKGIDKASVQQDGGVNDENVLAGWFLEFGDAADAHTRPPEVVQATPVSSSLPSSRVTSFKFFPTFVYG